MAQESRLAIVIDSRNAQRQVDQLRSSLNGLQGAGGEATVSVSGLGTAARAAGGALASIGVGAVTREVLRMTDAFKSMQGLSCPGQHFDGECQRVFPEASGHGQQHRQLA